MKRRILVSLIVIILVASSILVIALNFLGQSSPVQLKLLVVTGEGLQETYGFYNQSHVGTGYNYYRDKFWTESTSRWIPSTTGAVISLDTSTKTHGDSSLLFDFNPPNKFTSYYFYHQFISRAYGYLGKEGDKWLYFDIKFDNTTLISEFEVRVADFGGKNYYFTKYLNISSYPSNQWTRFKIHMNSMTPSNTLSWADVSRIHFNIQLASRAGIKVWIDDLMMTSNYHYTYALKNLTTLFKGVAIDSYDYDKLPANIDDYAAIIYFDNRINSTGISLIDGYTSRGGGLILMGLSTLWNPDGTERVDFPLSSSPVTVLNTTETFIDRADRADTFESHQALKPWNNYSLFEQRGLAGVRPAPYIGTAEIYNVSLRANTTPLITEKGFIYEATKKQGSGTVIYFAENLAKKIANGMLEGFGLTHGAGILGWAAMTGDRLQLLESAVNYVSKYPLPKYVLTPFAKKGGFLFTVETSASLSYYHYTNNTCTNVVGAPSDDTAFWHTVEQMKNQSEETGVVFTLLIPTEQLANTQRQGYYEVKFDPKNLQALLTAYQSPNIEIGLSSSNTITWPVDASSLDLSYANLLQAVTDIRNSLNLTDYEPLILRYPAFVRRGESMYGARNAGLYLDVTDESGSVGVPFSDSVAVPYINEAGLWELPNRGSFTTGSTFGTRVEGGNMLLTREQTYFDWYVENDMIYAVNTNDAAIAADPSHVHRAILGTANYSSKWTMTPTFLKYVSDQSERTWVTGGVSLAQYLKNWNKSSASTIYDAKADTYTLTIQNAPDGITVRLPLRGKHVSQVAVESEYILKEQGNFAYLALRSPQQTVTFKVTLGTATLASSQTVGYLPIAAVFLSRAPMFKTLLSSTRRHMIS